MEQLARSAGTWAGTNAFRLMPDDPPHDAVASARVSVAAGGNLLEVAYTWGHPRDGAQSGLLVVGRGPADGTVTAFWGDSWHQHPEPKVLEGTLSGDVLSVGYDYSGDWRWTITLDASRADVLALTMENTIPESEATESMAAGSYPAMAATLARA
ncbi:hypothetical protein DSM112329_02779 [Paraconexibacter sp. AEG42_29]|uniref:DUF1579 domain-containing protein n=1 Tax=Paraconexibacter sp. AEG42_29 TaxID=2997339 RepID=A0AAU7AWA3_9ACTN